MIHFNHCCSIVKFFEASFNRSRDTNRKFYRRYAFDGASNMCGIYNGLSAQLIQILPTHIHTWSATHVFDLIFCDTTDVRETTTLFNI